MSVAVNPLVQHQGALGPFVGSAVISLPEVTRPATYEIDCKLCHIAIAAIGLGWIGVASSAVTMAIVRVNPEIQTAVLLSSIALFLLFSGVVIICPRHPTMAESHAGLTPEDIARRKQHKTELKAYRIAACILAVLCTGFTSSAATLMILSASSSLYGPQLLASLGLMILLIGIVNIHNIRAREMRDRELDPTNSRFLGCRIRA